MTSAYPAPIETLIPQAQELAAALGEIPSRNKLMTQFKIGARKATQLREALAANGFDPTTVPADEVPARRLHAVPDDTTDTTDTDETVSTGPATPDTVAVDQTSVDTAPAQPDTAPSEQTDPAANPAADPSPAMGAGEAPSPAGRLRRLPASWPLLLLALPAFVAIWSGWVGLGELTGFGLVHPLPGIADGFTLNTAITLPIGVETYAAYALRVALASGNAPHKARKFAGWSAVASLALGFLGQVAYHLMTVQHITTAPWWITTVVSGLPVIVLGSGAALAHLQHRTTGEEISR
jgi:hypothetical protein